MTLKKFELKEESNNPEISFGWVGGGGVDEFYKVVLTKAYCFHFFENY